MKPIEILDLLQHGNIIEHFEWAVSRVPNKIAIIDKSKSITFSELHFRVLRAQEVLLDSGVKTGDKILINVPNRIELYTSVLALLRMGCTVVFLDDWTKRSRVSKACQLVDCQGFITSPRARFKARFIEDIRKIPIWVSSNKLGLTSTRKKSTANEVKSIFPQSDKLNLTADLTSPEKNSNTYGLNIDFESNTQNIHGISEINTATETVLITVHVGNNPLPSIIYILVSSAGLFDLNNWITVLKNAVIRILYECKPGVFRMVLASDIDKLITENDRLLAVEEQLRKMVGVSNGTVVELDGKSIYFVELEKHISLNEQVRLQIEKQFADLKLAHGQMFFVQLPMDPNQINRIDYIKLKELSRGSLRC